MVGEGERQGNQRRDSELLAYLSHELRTGLNAIVGHAQLLRDCKLGPEDADSVERIVDSGFYLASLLEEVGEIADDELRPSERVQMEAIELGPLLDRLASLLGPLAGAQGTTIDVEPIPPEAAYAVADRRRLTQILLNLISNGIKYGGGRVWLSVSRFGDRISVSVSDAGPGIDSQRLSELFKPFERLGAEKGPAPGSGIGLALSKRVAELAGATLTLNSDPAGHGATFTIGLEPAADPAKA
jgi:signal transduction histidine kinase